MSADHSEGDVSPVVNRSYESDTLWWVGVLISAIIWVFIFLYGNIINIPGVVSILVFIGWIMMPVSIYYDGAYVAEYSDWAPTRYIWIIGSLLMPLNIIIAAVYILLRRWHMPYMWSLDSYRSEVEMGEDK